MLKIRKGGHRDLEKYYGLMEIDFDSAELIGKLSLHRAISKGEAELLIVFDNEHPYGTVTGARTVYVDGETETVPKNEIALKKDDKIDFLCDYYDYDGNYQNSYMLGEQMTWTGEEEVSSVDISDYRAAACYCLTDLYGQEYWTPTMP